MMSPTNTYMIVGVKITEQQRIDEAEEYFKHGFDILYTYEDDISIVGTMLVALEDTGITEIDIDHINELIVKTKNRFESLGVDPDLVGVYSFHHVN